MEHGLQLHYVAFTSCYWYLDVSAGMSEAFQPATTLCDVLDLYIAAVCCGKNILTKHILCQRLFDILQRDRHRQRKPGRRNSHVIGD